MKQLCTSFCLFISIALISASARAAEGLITMKSPHPAKVTMDRVESLAKQRGLSVFARVDHAAGAASVGKTLRPTEVLIFGNPQGGTPFMECNQTVGIDLPLKVLVWEDKDAQVWLGYNDPTYLGKRHDAGACPSIETLSKALGQLSEAATSR